MFMYARSEQYDLIARVPHGLAPEGFRDPPRSSVVKPNIFQYGGFDSQHLDSASLARHVFWSHGMLQGHYFELYFN